MNNNFKRIHGACRVDNNHTLPSLIHLNFKILCILCKILFKTRTGKNGISQCKQKNEKPTTKAAKI